MTCIWFLNIELHRRVVGSTTDEAHKNLGNRRPARLSGLAEGGAVEREVEANRLGEDQDEEAKQEVTKCRQDTHS